MRVLLDTDLALWWQIAPELVPDSVLTTVRSPNTRAYMSDATLWELAEQCGNGRLHLDVPLFRHQCAADGFEWLPITAEHIMELTTLPVPPGSHAFCFLPPQPSSSFFWRAISSCASSTMVSQTSLQSRSTSGSLPWVSQTWSE